MKLFVSAILLNADRLVTAWQAEQIKQQVDLWMKHLANKNEALEIDWSGIKITNSVVMDTIFSDVIEKYSAYTIGFKLKHLNMGEVVVSEICRIFEFVTLYNNDVQYKEASNHIIKELHNLGSQA